MNINNYPYIVGETAFHHEGEMDFLEELIKAAADIGVNAIKFHALFNIHDYFVKTHEAIPLLQKISLSEKQIEQAVNLARSLNLEVVLLCNDNNAIKWALQHQEKIAAIEIHSTGLNDIFLLNDAAKFSNVVILGVGGSSIDEVKFAIDFLNEHGKKNILLMHGFQSYPTNYEDIFLERIEKYKQLFNLPMGYADHTDPLDKNNEWLSVMGIAKGALVIEKHFTTRFGEKRIDAQSAISIEQLIRVKQNAQTLFSAMGLNQPLYFSSAELNYGQTGPNKKALVAKTTIAKGEEISLQNVAFKRTKDITGIMQKDALKLIGLKAKQAIEQDEIIDFSKVEFRFKAVDFSQFKNTNK